MRLTSRSTGRRAGIAASTKPRRPGAGLASLLCFFRHSVSLDHLLARINAELGPAISKAPSCADTCALPIRICLSTSEGLDLWDHDSGLEPEPSYRTVLDLLLDAYKEQIEETQAGGYVEITWIPPQLPAQRVVSALKRIWAEPSAQLLASIRTLPLAFHCPRRDGMTAVRTLQRLGSFVSLGWTLNYVFNPTAEVVARIVQTPRTAA